MVAAIPRGSVKVDKASGAQTFNVSYNTVFAVEP